MISSSKPIIKYRNAETMRRRDGLIRYATDHTSQSGEDGIISRIFHVLDTHHSIDQKGKERKRICIDIGAWDGKHLSNTYSLLVGEDKNNNMKEKWHGILIEADKDRFQELRTLHEPLGNTCLNIEVSCISESPNSLVNIIKRLEKKEEIPKDFDFLTIDVDSFDYWLMEDMLNIGKYRPKLICIEFNPTMPNNLIYIQPRCDQIHHGNSLAALTELAMAYGYTLVETTLYNAFFLRTDLYEECFRLNEEIPFLPTIDLLHEPTMGTSMYQLYDGTMKLHGCKKLLWHRLPIDENKIQMIPENKRSFPFAPPPSSSSQTTTNDSSLFSTQIQNPSTAKEETETCREIYNSAVDISSYFVNPTFPASKETQSTSSTTNNNKKKESCAKELFNQIKSTGFCYIRGTPISQKLCQDSLHATKLFLNDAHESVRRSTFSKTGDKARRGYSPMNTENFASLIGEKDQPNDLVRKFRVGPSSSQTKIKTTTQSSSSILISSENIWPKENDPYWTKEQQDFFRTTIESFYKESCHVTQTVVKCICDGILQEYPHLREYLKVLVSFNDDEEKEKLGESDSDDMTNITNNNVNIDNGDSANNTQAQHSSILTILGYRKGSRHKQAKLNRPLVAPHTDVGVITLLLFDDGDCAKLQRKQQQQQRSDNNDKEKEDDDIWVDVKLPLNVPEDPVFVINIGDLFSDLVKHHHEEKSSSLQQHASSILPSTIHRVMPCLSNNSFSSSSSTTTTTRNCLALFMGLDPSLNLKFPSSPFCASLDDEHDDDEKKKKKSQLARLEPITISYEEWRKKRILASSIVVEQNKHKHKTNQ